VLGEPDPVLVVGDEGCSPVVLPEPDEVRVGCQLDLRPLVVEAAGSVELTMTVWRDLPGFVATPGSYVFAKDVQFTDEFTQPDVPNPSTLRTGSIEVTYTV
jgi:hypothetical protein